MEYADFINDIVPDCPGVPVPVAIRALRESARRFCRESTSYRKALTAGDLSYTAGIYTLAVPANTQLETVVSPIGIGIDTENTVYAQGISKERMDKLHPGWRSETSADRVDYFVMLSTDTLVLAPDSGIDRSDAMTVTLVLMPDRTTTTLDDEFGQRWFDELVAGAKAFLMLMPGVRWTNPELAQFYGAKFDAGIEAAKRYAKSGLRHPVPSDGTGRVRAYFK